MNGVQRILYFVILIAVFKSSTGQDISRHFALFKQAEDTGIHLHNAGKFREAIPYFKKAISFFGKVPSVTEDLLYQPNLYLGHSYYSANVLDSATYFYKNAEAIAARYPGETNDTGKSVRHAIICKNIGDFYASVKNYDSALIRYQQAINNLVFDFDEEDVRLNPASFNGQYSVNELFGALLAKAKTFTVRYQQQHNKNDLLSSLFAYDALYKLAAYVIRTYNPEQAILLLNNQKHLSHNEPIENALKLYELTGDSVYLRHAFRFDEESKLWHLHKRFGGHPNNNSLKYIDNTIDVRDFQKKIPRNYAVLSFQLGDTSLLGFLITGTKFRYVYNTIDSNFKTDVKKLYELIQLTDQLVDVQIVRLTDSLYGKIIAPFAEDIEVVERLMIIPDDELLHVPFEILGSGGKRKLINKYAIAYNYSCSLLKQDADSANTIVSMWRATDESTQKINRYLQQYVGDGKSFAESLQRAKKDYITEVSGHLKLPAYWAHLRLIGNFEKPETRHGVQIMIAAGLLVLITGIIFLYRRRI
jgi:tetratricopeptide (TPR) repeat protein